MDPVQDAAMPVPTAQDLVIAVMGITGSGKSTFISKLIEDDDVVVGHALASCTAEVHAYSFVYRNTRRVFLVDTPGFNDTNRSDTNVLRDITFFLSKTYRATIRLAGVVYLHRITDRRMQGSSLKNLSMFKKLCGEDAFGHVVLVTTMWDDLPSYEEGVEREAELMGHEKWWGAMYHGGSKVIRHSGSRDSARSIVAELLANARPVVLQIQREMVDEQKCLEYTAAGQEVHADLLEAEAQLRGSIREVEVELRRALQSKDHDMAEMLRMQHEEWNAKLQQISQDQSNLRINLQSLEQAKEKEISRLMALLEQQKADFDAMQAEQAAELARLRAARREDIDQHHRLQAVYDRKLAELHRTRDHEDRWRDHAETKHVAAEERRIQRFKAKSAEEFRQAQKASEEQEDSLEQELQAMEEKAKKRARVTKALRVLAAVAGVGVTIAGLVTMNPAIVVAGTGLLSMPIGNKALTAS